MTTEEKIEELAEMVKVLAWQAHQDHKGLKFNNMSIRAAALARSATPKPEPAAPEPEPFPQWGKAFIEGLRARTWRR